MAANKYGIDVAGMYKDVNAIKGGRTQNKLSALKLSEEERVIRERPEKERLAAERQNMLTGLRGQAASGNENAVQQLMATDPEGGAKFMKAIGEMDDRKIEATKRTVEEIGKTAHSIINIKDPEKQSQVYKMFYDQASPEIKAGLSPNFNMGEMTIARNKAASMADILENPKSISVGKREDVYKMGKKIDSALKPVKDSSSGKGGYGSGTKAADESLMYKQSVELFGGIFDSAGNITNLDPQTRNKVQRVATEATNEYVRSGNITRTEAVTRAAKKFKLSIPTKTGEQYLEGQRITNPSTGEVMIMSNGKWVSLGK